MNACVTSLGQGAPTVPWHGFPAARHSSRLLPPGEAGSAVYDPSMLANHMTFAGRLGVAVLIQRSKGAKRWEPAPWYNEQAAIRLTGSATRQHGGMLPRQRQFARPPAGCSG